MNLLSKQNENFFDILKDHCHEYLREPVFKSAKNKISLSLDSLSKRIRKLTEQKSSIIVAQRKCQWFSWHPLGINHTALWVWRHLQQRSQQARAFSTGLADDPLSPQREALSFEVSVSQTIVNSLTPFMSFTIQCGPYKYVFKSHSFST